MECLAENGFCKKAVNDRRGTKRSGADGNSETKKFRFKLGEVGENLADENRGLEEIELDFEGLEEERVIEWLDKSLGGAFDMTGEARIEDGVVGVGLGESSVRCKDNISKGNEASCSTVRQLNNNVGVGYEKREFEFDLNVSVWDAEDEGFDITPVVGEMTMEIVEILSDDDGDEEDVIVLKEVKGKRKLSDGVNACGSSGNVKFGRLGELDLSMSLADSGTSSGVRRYTREEKGKTKVGDSWLSLANMPIGTEILAEGCEFAFEQDVDPALSLHFDSVNLGRNGDPLMKGNHKHRAEQSGAYSATKMPVQFKPMLIAQPSNQISARNTELRREQVVADNARALNAPRQRADRVRHREIATDRAYRFARFNPLEEIINESSLVNTEMTPSLEADEQLLNSPGPFSDALKTIRERCLKKSAQQLIVWRGRQNTSDNISAPLVPSLQDLSLKTLLKNAYALVSLDCVPDILRRKIVDLLCDARKMNSRLFGLLLQGSPTEIRVKDCSWLTEDDFSKSFGDFDGQNLLVLQLDLCGQCLLDHVLDKTLLRSSHRLPKLGILSLRGACRMSDDGLRLLVAEAPILQSIDLGQCSLLTHSCINIISKSLCSSLKELRINECQRIDAMQIISGLKNLKHLEVLSVAGIQTICDQFVCQMLPACGQNLKELDLADCENLTDCSLKAIGGACADLLSLNISNLHKLTDVGLQFLANGCRSIQRLVLRCNSFSDEAIAAYLEASGQSLEELSLNNCSKVGPSTALSLAKCSIKLYYLDLSWCRRVTDDSLGVIVDSCISLKLLKLFGCTQITSTFINGHSNSLVQIVGLPMTPILDHIIKFEPEEVLLRYSSLRTCADTS
ncbi:unnamed protein product [Cuscuta campestris]|uniref:F-box/LRR-repeat protein 15-like leucin rich repeat domain-containing protein n=1 Tax=Cuscuta campestris TaxID=132261 RepID=A0A484NB71_9ASTE|nr:unnamed protein product [Cuscuta campestris]